MKSSALILNYHLIDNEDYDFDAFGGIYAVKKDSFEEQMSFLYTNNVKVISLNEILENKIENKFCIILTFDDGNPSDYEIVFPILKKYKFPATFFVSIQNINKNGVIWENYQKIHEFGFNLGSHGINHKDLTLLDSLELRKELEQSKEIIENNTNFVVSFFSLPFGRYNSKVTKLAIQLGYKGLLTTQFDILNLNKLSFVLNRWSIKRSTTISEFKEVVMLKKNIIRKYRISSLIKKYIISGIGSTLTNKLYTFKNKFLHL